MAFIEKQRHGKHDYYYLVKSVRISPEKVRKVRVFLGRAVPDHDRMQAHFEELEKKLPAPYEARWLSKETVERIEDLRSSVAVFQGIRDPEKSEEFLIRYTYNTNAIEGNPLTLRQTALILAEGITPEGAKTEHVVEVLNGKDAWEYVKDFKGPLTEAFLCKVQFEVTKNTTCRFQGSFRDVEVGISGSNWKPPLAKNVPAGVRNFVKEFKTLKKNSHPIELAAWLHNQVAQIHPFTDGNGRTARLLMNWVLRKNKFPPAIIEVRNKERYYRALEQADRGNEKPFAEFLAGQLLDQYTLKKD